MAIPENTYHELIILIEGSKIMSEKQKEALHKKITELSDREIYKLVDVLKKEQIVLAEHYHNIAQIHKRTAEKKIKAIYRATEEMVGIVEKNEIHSLENQLDALEA